MTGLYSAWLLANRVAAVIPNDSAFRALRIQFSRKSVLRSVPDGAKVYRASFDDTTHWTLLGAAPTDTIFLPQYKAFVDAGGYAKREWWPAEITDGRKSVSWEAAIARFSDKTGRPGPG